jgi:Uroporphyrinogen decarboxylase (URO-D)
MTPFERFDAALSHRKPDKVPFYFPTIACTVASELLGRPVDAGADSLHFKEELSWFSGDDAHAEFVDRHQRDAIALNLHLRADVVRETWRSPARPTRRIDDNTLLFGPMDGPHVIKRFFPGQQTYGIVEDTQSPATVEDLVALLRAEMARGVQPVSTLEENFADQLRFKRLADPHFPAIGSGAGFGIPMTSAAWLEAVATEPGFLAEYFEFRADDAIRQVGWMRERGYRFINAGVDIASRRGPVLSPASFRAILSGPLRRVAAECRRLGLVYCFRTDGNTWALMDDLFGATGIQAYGEVDREASMAVGAIHARHPGLIVLGNVSSSVLSQGTEAQVREETRAGLEESRGLDYIAGPSNAVVHGTPAPNVLAMVEEIERYRP